MSSVLSAQTDVDNGCRNLGIGNEARSFGGIGSGDDATAHGAQCRVHIESDQRFILDDLNTLGWVVIVLGIIQLTGGISLMSGNTWGRFIAIVGGVLGALFGMGGPPYVMYIAGRIADPAAQRATISQMVILNVGLRVVAFAVAGLLVSPALWVAVACLLPVAWAGVWVGHRVHVRVAPATVARAVSATLFATGAVLVARTL